MDVVIVGDGPGGLSAALFLAKNGLSTVVYGQDKTAMHWALVRNYLGVNDIHGSEFQKLSRQQVARWGALLQDRHVDAVTRNGSGFNVTLEGQISTPGPGARRELRRATCRHRQEQSDLRARRVRGGPLRAPGA
jgi:thioredoxin reductase